MQTVGSNAAVAESVPHVDTQSVCDVAAAS